MMTTPTPSHRALFSEALDLVAKKTAEDEARIGVEFPYVTAPDGSWRTLPASLSAGYSGEAWSHGNWFCGFWVGLLLAGHLHTGDERLMMLAKERMRLVAQRALDANTHDIGFIFESSAVPGFHITGDSFWSELALTAADRLRARLVTTPAGAYLASWGPIADPRGRRSSAIDTMANLPLLYWAADHADDGSFRHAALAHARMTEGAFVRPDLSTYHAVDYDLATGERRRGYTFQGHGDESCWPRGQGWAIYGAVATAAATGDVHWIHLAERLATYWFARVDDTLIPFWDFDDPAIPNALRDTSASAIVAAALVDLADIHPDAAAGEAWRARACALLEALCGEPLAREDAHRGLLKHGCYSKPHNDGVDSTVMFGDYFFVEALCKLTMPGKFLPARTRL